MLAPVARDRARLAPRRRSVRLAARSCRWRLRRAALGRSWWRPAARAAVVPDALLALVGGAVRPARRAPDAPARSGRAWPAASARRCSCRAAGRRRRAAAPARSRPTGTTSSPGSASGSARARLRIPYRGCRRLGADRRCSPAAALLARRRGAGRWPRAPGRGRPLRRGRRARGPLRVPVVERGPASPLRSTAFVRASCSRRSVGRAAARRRQAPRRRCCCRRRVAALIAARGSTPRGPWIDYEQIAESLAAASASRFRWNHRYAPLTGPATAARSLRIKSRARLYWKARRLERVRRRRAGARRAAAATPVSRTPRSPQPPRAGPRRVGRGQGPHSSRQFFARGHALRIRACVDQGRRLGGHARTFVTGGGRCAAATATGAGLRRRGRSSPSCAARAPTTRRSPAATCASTSRPRVGGPAAARPRRRARAAAAWRFPQLGRDAPTVRRRAPASLSGTATRTLVLRESAYGPMYELAQRAAERVERRPTTSSARAARASATARRYTETPPAARRSRWTTSSSGDHERYCQQFSGAMALMLRMGGVPARVASGLRARALRQRARRVHRPRPRRALLGRGLLPAHRLGPVRPDAGRLARPRSQPTRRRGRRRLGADRATAAAPGRPARRTRAAATRRRASRRLGAATAGLLARLSLSTLLAVGGLRAPCAGARPRSGAPELVELRPRAAPHRAAGRRRR